MTDYNLEDQVGHLLRRANQRHKAIFSSLMPVKIPPTQFAALALLRREGPLSQNLLGRMSAMDSATIAGVVSRLAARGWVKTAPSETDSRMTVVGLTDEGADVVDSLIEPAREITSQTLASVPAADRDEVLRLLRLLAADPD